MRSMLAARSMPLFVLESLSTMVRTYCESCDSGTVRQMHTSLDELVAPYGECERIRHNPFAFAYVAHLRLLIVMYIVTLPLALVEQMGFSTIPVFWTICYSLMSLEMLAVEVENPFGHGRSDLPLFEYNLLIKESLLESWERWQLNLETCACSEQIQEKYNNLGVHCSNSACVASYGEGNGAGESGYWTNSCTWTRTVQHTVAYVLPQENKRLTVSIKRVLSIVAVATHEQMIGPESVDLVRCVQKAAPVELRGTAAVSARAYFTSGASMHLTGQLVPPPFTFSQCASIPINADHSAPPTRPP
eukprot:IDg17309t1